MSYPSRYDPAPHRLAAQASCTIQAKHGLRLEVLRGCLWLTRPFDAVDYFLSAGMGMDLHEADVVIQSSSLPNIPSITSATSNTDATHTPSAEEAIYTLAPVPAHAAVTTAVTSATATPEKNRVQHYEAHHTA